jgi:hypothetical protein
MGWESPDLLKPHKLLSFPKMTCCRASAIAGRISALVAENSALGEQLTRWEDGGRCSDGGRFSRRAQGVIGELVAVHFSLIGSPRCTMLFAFGRS